MAAGGLTRLESPQARTRGKGRPSDQRPRLRADFFKNVFPGIAAKGVPPTADSETLAGSGMKAATGEQLRKELRDLVVFDLALTMDRVRMRSKVGSRAP